MFRHYISADVPAPRTGPRRHGLLGRGLALCSHPVADNWLWIQTHLQQVRHVGCLAEIFAECPWSPIKTTQSCFLLILHTGPWHLRTGKHRYARPTMRHHDPLVTKPLQHRVVWKREVVLKIVVDPFIIFVICTHARSYTRPHRRTCEHVYTKKIPAQYDVPRVPQCSNACASACVRCCY